MMYGRQSEIQRIQAKLQRIGQANPYRPHLNQVPRNEGSGHEMRTEKRRTDQRRNLEQRSNPCSNPSVNNEETGTSLQQTLAEVPPFISTHDRYHTPAGQQALKEMGEVAKLPDPLPKAVTFSPQSPWSNSPWNRSPWSSQISTVDSEASKSSHQLAHRLRQHRYTSDSDEDERGYSRPTVDSVPVDWNREAYGSSSRSYGEGGHWIPSHRRRLGNPLPL